MMALVILAAMVVPIVLAYFGVLAWQAAVVAELAILFIAAWGIDRRRRPGARDPFLDSNRAEFPVSMAVQDLQVPTEAVQSPSDRRSPE